MKFSTLADLFLLGAPLFSGVAQATPIDVVVRKSLENAAFEKKWGGKGKAEAVYLMTNQKENAVIAIKVAEDGTLGCVGSTTATGGSGGNEVDPKTGVPAGPDALSSQGSLQIAGNYLFAINAGSNSLSMMKIDSHNPMQLALLGEPCWTGGDFPVSVAVTLELGIACVGNAGAATGVSCATFDESGLGTFDAIRPFALGQVTPPTAPLNDIAQVLFSDDLSELIVTVKGNGTAANQGFVATFAVNAAAKQVSTAATKSIPAGARVLFGTVPIPGTTKLLASDAAFGALLLDLTDLSTPIALTNITNQVATCWAIYSSVTGTGFVDDVVVSHLVEIDITTGAIVGMYPDGNAGQGMIDLRTVGNKIYANSPGNGSVPAAVTVFDISGGRGSATSVQNFVVEGADKNAEGMAVYVSGWW